MKKVGVIFISIGIISIMNSCRHRNDSMVSGREIGNVIHQMSAVMIHDVTNPPLAARFFSYTCLSGYEVVSENDKRVPTMYGRLNQYPDIRKPSTLSGYNYQLTAILAMYKTAEKLQPSGSTFMAKNERGFIDSCKKIGFDQETIDSSESYAKFISKKILTYARADKYNRMSNYRRYTPDGTPGSWVPTPPSYLPPVETYFSTIRPFTLDSSSQFVSEAPIPFSADKRSAFYKYLLMNYVKSGHDLMSEEKNTADFWDCNPFAVQNEGHMLVGLKKISPGAHWMGIANIACEKARASFSKTMQVNTVESVGLLDCFICCWEEKYRTNRIRPETAIRKYIDPKWTPWLQTPPFPEYTSGHSVVSATSAVILTHYFGEHFAYTDNVEQDFGIPPRHFNSFRQAANQAAISRFLGGIHYMDAINNGLKQGDVIGKWVLGKCTASLKK